MVQGYTLANGIYLPLTRISNATVIITPENLTLGDNIYIGHFNNIEASNQIIIAEGCQISNYISILTHSSHQSIRLYGHHYIEHNGKHLAYVKGAVKIGKFTFVGPHSVIMPGTTIGKGSIVSAYSMVKGEFPDFSVIAGNPAKVVGDTREIDAKILAKYPELQSYYDEWAKE